MPDGKRQETAGGARSAGIFTSAAYDPPIALPSRRLRIAAVAMGVNAAIWLLVSAVSLGAGAPPDLLLMSFVGAGFDAFIAVQLWQQQRSKAILAYVAIRAILAAAGFVLACLPAYLIAVLAIPIGAPSGDAILDRDEPHAFRPKSSGWLSGFAPIRVMGGMIGAGMFASRNCVCGLPEDAPVHEHEDPDI